MTDKRWAFLVWWFFVCLFSFISITGRVTPQARLVPFKYWKPYVLITTSFREHQHKRHQDTEHLNLRIWKSNHCKSTQKKAPQWLHVEACRWFSKLSPKIAAITPANLDSLQRKKKRDSNYLLCFSSLRQVLLL